MGEEILVKYSLQKVVANNRFLMVQLLPLLLNVHQTQNAMMVMYVLQILVKMACVKMNQIVGFVAKVRLMYKSLLIIMVEKLHITLRTLVIIRLWREVVGPQIVWIRFGNASIPVATNLQSRTVMGMEYVVTMDKVVTPWRSMIRKLHLEDNLVPVKQNHLTLVHLLLYLLPPHLLQLLLLYLLQLLRPLMHLQCTPLKRHLQCTLRTLHLQCTRRQLQILYPLLILPMSHQQLAERRALLAQNMISVAERNVI